MTDRSRRAVIYVRQSKEREGSYSPETQEKGCREYAKRKGYTVVDVVPDIDVSGRKWARRPGLQRIVKMAQAGEIDVVIVYWISRGARHDTVWLNIKVHIEQIGVRLESPELPDLDPDDPVAYLIREDLQKYANFDSKVKSAIWRKAQADRVELGLNPGSAPPLGYVKTGKGRVPPTIFEPHREHLAEAYKMYVRGHGPKSIAEYLNQAGVRMPPKKSRKTDKVARAAVSVSAIARWLDSGYAAGYLTLHDRACYERDSGCKIDPETGRRMRWDTTERAWKPCTRTARVKGAHEPIITEDVWQQYLRARESRRRLRPKDRQPKWFLGGGLTVCGQPDCGANMTVNSHTHEKAQAICSRYMQTRECAGTWILKRWVEHAVLNWVDDHVRQFVERAEEARGVDEQRAKLTAALDEARAQVETITTGLADALELVQLGVASKEDYVKRAMKTEQQRDTIAARIANIEAQLDALNPNADELERMSALFDAGDLASEEWRVVLGKVIKRVVIDPERLVIEPWNDDPKIVSRNALPRKPRSDIGKHKPSVARQHRNERGQFVRSS